MKLSSYRRLFDQDFDPQYKDLIETLSITVNASFEEIYDALSNKLSFRDNFNSTIVELTVNVNSSGVPKNDTKFKLTNSQTTFEGLLVLDAKGSEDSTLLPVSGVFVSAVKSENSIVIKNIKGLQADKPYKLKVIALG